VILTELKLKVLISKSNVVENIIGIALEVAFTGRNMPDNFGIFVRYEV